MPSSHLILWHPLSSCPQSFPALGSFPMSQLFTSGGQSIGASASASVLPMITQDWPPLGWTGLISLQSKGLSRVFSNTTVQKHQFFGAQLSLWSNSHFHTWLVEKAELGLYEPLLANWCLCFLTYNNVSASSPSRTAKLQLVAEQPSTGECWIPPKQDTPCPRAKVSPNKTVGGAK